MRVERRSITAFAPATVSNVGCGFDVLGFALEGLGDRVTAVLREAAGVDIISIRGDGGRLSRDPSRNTAGAAVAALLARVNASTGISLTICKGIPLASGVGSSGASAVAAVVAVNELLDRPASIELLLECAMAGEIAGCGTPHPDNVAPALFGGFVLARSVNPPDIVPLPVPRGLACAILHPHFEIETGMARALLGDTLPLRAAARQWANVGGLVAGLFLDDTQLISRSLTDHVAESKRSVLLPGLDQVKEAARAAGALGCSLSGAGPSMFALCASMDIAAAAGPAMLEAYRRASARDADVWLSAVGAAGARVTAGH